MNPLTTLRHAIGGSGAASDKSYSMVLLEKHHLYLGKETLIVAAERAFNHSFADGDPKYSIHQSASTFMQVGDYTINVSQSSKPYRGHGHEVETHTGDGHLHHHAWKYHEGYVAFDVRDLTHRRRDVYRVLAAITLELLADHVTGVFIPRENDVFPNDGSALEHLEQLKKL